MKKLVRRKKKKKKKRVFLCPFFFTSGSIYLYVSGYHFVISVCVYFYCSFYLICFRLCFCILFDWIDIKYQLEKLEDGKNDIPKYFYKLAGTPLFYFVQSSSSFSTFLDTYFGLLFLYLFILISTVFGFVALPQVTFSFTSFL